MSSTKPVCPAVAAAQVKAGLSYAQIAEQIGQPEAEVAALLKTADPHPQPTTVRAVANVLNIHAQLPQNTHHGQ